MRVHNGYEIRGNLAEVGRHYQVCDDKGNVLHSTTARKQEAINFAESLPPGPIKPPEPPPAQEKPKAKRTTRSDK